MEDQDSLVGVHSGWLQKGSWMEQIEVKETPMQQQYNHKMAKRNFIREGLRRINVSFHQTISLTGLY